MSHDQRSVRRNADPVAVIGMSCRFAPDLDSPGKLWTYLAEGRSTVGEMPGKRWDPYAAASPQATAVLRHTTRKGCYLDDIEGFDAEFFGISPREADYLDPQQRVILELAWEALVGAGIAPLSLGGSETGVFVTANSNDYGRRLLEDIPRTGAYAVNGTTYYGIANRISYFLDLRGPSMAVDTACAGSLTALHLACQSLHLGEAPVAIAGGVNIMASPALFVALDAAGATSPDGRSKAFDKAADGYGRGEGAGVLVLKPLSAARRDGDPVLALIRGSGVFQDGRSDGMMAPRGDAQEHMLRQTYARAGVAPGSVDYVEAHGTGTPAGDRAEAQALAAVFGRDRPAGEPCLIGSVKPNLGHTEACSGIAGVIKAVLALQHGEIPPSLHSEPTPDVDWHASGLRLVGERAPWPAGPRPRRAGISSYGVGGSIAHLILEEAPRTPQPAEGSAAPAAETAPSAPSTAGPSARPSEDVGPAGDGTAGTPPTPGDAPARAPKDVGPAGDAPAGAPRPGVGTARAPHPSEAPAGAPRPGVPSVYPLSAMSAAGLRALAAVTADWLAAHPGVAPAAVGRTLSVRRSHLAHRAAVVAAGTGELVARLRAFADGGRTPGVATGRTGAGHASGVVMVFSGHGAQWSGMGRRLLRDEPVFAAALDELAGVFREETGWTPREELLRGGPGTAAQTQALTFAVQIGLTAVWRRHGIVPAAVVGHSVGEIAAAVAAGALDPLEAARFACRRANALERLAGAGAMAMAALSFEQARERLAGRADVVPAIAASPGSTVVSGDAAAVREVAARWRAEGVDVRPIDTDIAFHSPHVDAVADEVAAAAAALHPRPARIALYGTAMADPRAAAERGSAYWTENLRRPVRFAAAVQAAAEDGRRVFLEVSSHPVVAHSVRETLEHLGVEDATVSSTLRRDAEETTSLLGALAELHCGGAAVDWSSEHPAGGLVPMPGVVWQHRPYWIFPEAATASGPGGGHDPSRHSLLGGRMTVGGAPPCQVWQTHLDLTCRPYPQDHLVVGVEITPAASILHTLALAAAQGGEPPALSDVVLRTPLAVTPPRVVQVVRSENTLRLASRISHDGSAPPDDEAHEWITHTTATVDRGRRLPAGRRVDAAAVRSRCEDAWDRDRVDALFTTKGVGGYAFPWVLDELRRSDSEQLSVLTLEPAPARRSASWAHVVDAALTISAVLVTPADARRLWMSCAIGGVVFRGEPPAAITVHTRRSAQSPADTVDVLVAGEDGEVVCEVGGLRFAPLQDQADAVAAPRDLVHEIVWRPLEPAPGPATAQRVLMIGDDPEAGPLAAQLAALAGTSVTRVASPEDAEDARFAQATAVLVTPARAAAGETAASAAERCAWTLIRTAQRLARLPESSREDRPRLWALTRGVRDAAGESSLAHAPLWGVARIIAGEHPELWGGVVDLGGPGADDGRGLLGLLGLAAGREDVIALSGEGAAVPRLAPAAPPAGAVAPQCRPDGTYLVTGGLGALGLLAARRLVDRGATRLLLAGRRGLPPRGHWDRVREPAVRRQIDDVLALEALGATVRVLALDVTDPDAVAGALDPATHGLPPVRGLVHAAGVTHDAMLGDVDRDGLRRVLAPKADGAMVLHRLFPPGTLDFFVMFSSCGQFARLTGQTSYAAANSFLDALAAHRAALGDAGTASLGWTAWRGVGMSESIGGTMLEANARGLEAVSPAEALRAWSFADLCRAPCLAVLRVLPSTPGTVRPPMLRELTAVDAGTGDEPGGTGFVLDWDIRSEQELRGAVAAEVCEQVAAELNLAAGDVDPRRPLVEMGVDSVMTVALRVRLARRFGLDLPPTILWDKPTVAALAGHLLESLRPRAGEVPAPAGAAGEGGGDLVRTAMG